MAIQCDECYNEGLYKEEETNSVLYEKSDFTKEIIFGPDLQNYVGIFLVIATWYLMSQKHQKVCFWIVLWFTEVEA